MRLIHVKSTVRYIKKNKLFSGINLLGLVVGIAVSIIIFQWIDSEFSYNSHHTNSDNIFLVGEKFYAQNETRYSRGTPGLLAPVLKQEYPEITNTTRVLFSNATMVGYSDNSYMEYNVFAVDNSFFDIFTLPFVFGDKNEALLASNSIVISESLATKYFGSETPIGKNLLINGQNDYVVTGVIKDTPKNSTFNFEILFPYKSFENRNARLQSWYYSYVHTYALLNPNTDIKRLEEKIAKRAEDERPEKGSSLFLFPLKKQHLYSIDGNISKSRILQVNIFAILAIVILVIASINYVNLTSVQLIERIKETSIRKVLGANKINLIKQSVIESFTFTLFALIISIVLIQLTKSYLSNLIGQSFFHQWYDFRAIVVYLIVLLLISFSVGFYLSIFMSKSASVVEMNKKNKKSSAKQALVIFQFVASIVLLVSTITITRQINYINNKPLGIDKNNIVYIPVSASIQNNFNVIKNRLLARSDIEAITTTLSAPNSNGYAAAGVAWEGKNVDNEIFFNYEMVDADFDDVFGVKLAQGRFFSDQFTSDKQKGILINETAVREMNIEAPVGKTMTLWGNQYNILGVVKDYHFNSLKDKIKPLLLLSDYNQFRYLYVKLNAAQSSQNFQNTIREIQKVITPYNDGFDFEYFFVADVLSDSYTQEAKMSNLFSHFTLVAILISCLGLLGLTIFSLKQRIKEIGVRKVNGAKISEILVLINTDFIKWVVFAFVIAVPIAWYMMNKWLENFAYRTTLSWWIFAMAGIFALAIALVTVSWQSWRAATRNPVEALRYE